MRCGHGGAADPARCGGASGVRGARVPPGGEECLGKPGGTDRRYAEGEAATRADRYSLSANGSGAPAQAIGLDVGGTKIAAMRVDGDGTILARERVPTPADDMAATLDSMV